MGATLESVEKNLPLALQEMFNKLRERALQAGQEKFPIYGRPRMAPDPADMLRARELGRQATFNEPALREAEGITRGQRPYHEAYKQQMSPYIQEVVERLRTEGLKNLKPIQQSLDAKFAGLGQFGSTRHQRASAMAAKEIEENIRKQQAQALEAGYWRGADTHAQDQDRNLRAAEQIARLGGLGQAGKILESEVLAKQGAEQRSQDQALRDLAYKDWLREQNWEWDQLSKIMAAQQGMPIPTQDFGVRVAPSEPVMNSAGSLGQIALQGLGLNTEQRHGKQIEQRFRARGGHIKDTSRLNPQTLAMMKKALRSVHMQHEAEDEQEEMISPGIHRKIMKYFGGN